MTTEQDVVRKLAKGKMTVTTVESCTGGMVAAALTSVPGSSEVFRQGYVTYCDDAKHKLVGVRKKTLRRYTAVSKAVASEMAAGGARRAKADCCLAVTGYAGPDAPPGQPVGLVYIGCCFRGKTKVKKFLFHGTRQEIRAQAAEQALRILQKRFKK